MKQKRILTVLLVVAALLFVLGKAIRTAWLPHVKTDVVTNGSISYTFPGWQATENQEFQYYLEIEAAYADSFAVGSEARWVPYAEAEPMQIMKIIALEKTDTGYCATLEGLWKPGTVSIENGTIQVDSPFYPALVPRNAFVTGDTVYVIQEEVVGEKRQKVAAICKVKTAPGNEQSIPCVAGIASGVQVIVAWDRSMTAGQPVEIVSSTGW